jgi:hypothetical protein
MNQIVNNGLMAAIKKKLDSAQLQIERSMQFLSESDADQERIDFLKNRLEQAEKYRSRIEKLMNNPLVRKLI